MDKDVFDAIIGSVYRAAAGLGDWRRPLESIAREFGLWGSQIIGVDKRSGTLLFSFEGCGPSTPQTSVADSALDYLRTYHTSNPRLLPSMQLRLGSWMHCHEHFDDDYVANSAFYQDFLIPYGGRYLSGTKLVDDDQMMVFFGAMRGVGSRPLDSSDIQELTRLRVHMVEAFGIYRKLRDTYAQAGVGKQLLDEFRYPALLIDQYRAVLYRNQAATHLLARHDALLCKGARLSQGGQLQCLNADDNARLIEALRSLGLNSAEATGRRNRTFLRLTGVPGQNGVAMFLSAIRPEEAMQSFGHTSLALLVLHEPSTERIFDPFIIGEIFGLTPAEAKVAAAIASGRSVERMAVDFGVALSTIRTQLKSVFSKTGTARQSELASLLMNLPDI
jgi:DNA-binding CsgD family transcriptional regulator